MAGNRRVILAKLPTGKLAASDFELEEAPMPQPGPGQLLLRTRILSLDPANRAWMQGATYRSKLEGGTVMAGLAVSEVLESRDPGFVAGDLVEADSGWQTYAVIDAAVAKKRPAVPQLTHLMSVYGTSPLTAHVGLFEIGDLKAGDTVVVTAAAGSVGTAVGQIARIAGARVVGIAGGPEKCRWLVEELGFDAAIDYKAGGLGAQLREAVPGGIDLLFDNVGGAVLDACIFAMNEHGRIICCGAVASYDGDKPTAGPRGVPGVLIVRRLSMRGFILYDHPEATERAMDDIRSWQADGRFRAIEDVLEGLEAAPAGLVGLLAGENRGKRMVRVS